MLVLTQPGVFVVSGRLLSLGGCMALRWVSEATRGVAVSTFAFLTCHQCYCAGSSLAWGLNHRAAVCGIF